MNIFAAARSPKARQRAHDHFDVAVVGDALPGLMAAALLAKMGRRVLVLLPARQKPACFGELAGPLHVCPESPLVRQVHERLGMPLTSRFAGIPLPRQQVLLPDARIDLPTGNVDLQQCLGLQFPDMRAPLNAFLERLAGINRKLDTFFAQVAVFPAERFWDRCRSYPHARQIQRYLAPFDAGAQDALFGGIGADHPLRALLLAPWRLPSTGAGYANIFVAVRAMASQWLGTQMALGTRPDAQAQFLQRAQAAGAVVRQTQAPRALYANKRIVAVQDQMGAAVTQVDAVLANTGQPLEVCPHEQAAEAGAGGAPATPKQADGHMSGPHTARLQLHIAAGRLPVGLQACAYFVSAAAGAHAQQQSAGASITPVSLEHQPPAKPELGTLAERSDDVLLLRVAVQPGSGHGEAAAAQQQQQLEEISHAALRQVMPFLAQHLRQAQWLAPVPCREPEPQAGTSVAARSISTAWRNMWQTSTDVLPALGAEGYYATALRAAELLLPPGQRPLRGSAAPLLGRVAP